jgi:hypothetical protein
MSMFNLPDISFLQTPEWQSYIQAVMAGDPNAADLNPLNPNFVAGGTYTPVPTDSYKVDGTRYGGQFAKQDVSPFRTVESAGQYGTGLNASAAQIYDHYRSSGRKAADYGFKPAGEVQTIQDFLARRQPTITPPPPAPIDEVTPLNPNTATSGGATNPRQSAAPAPMFDIAQQQFDRNNIFGQTANRYSNFQPPAPPTLPNMGGPMARRR